MGDDRDRLFVLKFVEPQFTKSTLDGGLFFKRSGHFVELEADQLEKGIGDSKEGVWISTFKSENYTFTITDFNDKEISLPFEKVIFEQTFSDLKLLPICCFVILSLKRDFDINYEERNAVIKKEVQEELITQFAGRDLILFRSSREFVDRIDTALNKNGLDRMRGLVHYYDNENETHPIEEKEFLQAPFKSLLYKRKFFEFQKEFRYVIKEMFDKDFTLELGDIRDIAANLGEVKQGKDLFRINFPDKK